jgi:signal transduction histidine kinase
MTIRLASWGAVESDLVARPVSRRSAHVVSRFTAREHGAEFWIALWALAIAGEFGALVPVFFGDEPMPGWQVVFRLIGGSFAAAGLVAWRRRPDSRSGLLMTATGFLFYLFPLLSQIDAPAAATLSMLVDDYWTIPFVALLLTYVTGGRLRSRIDRTLVWLFVLPLVILEFIWLLFLEEEGNVLTSFPNADIANVIDKVQRSMVLIGCVGTAFVVAARWRAASPPRRRALLPSVAGCVALLLFASLLANDLLGTGVRGEWHFRLTIASLALVPLAFLAGLLRSRLARGGLADLFRGLRTMRGAELQAALAKTMGDPALVVARRIPGRAAYVDADGDPVSLPSTAGERRIVPVERDGREIAAIVYASRERIVTAGDTERRRLERNLHDGAQQRLVALSMQLRLLQGRIREDPSSAEALVTTASDELALSLDELRELARGLHPAILDHGLEAALESLASRSPVPTTVSYEAHAEPPQPVALAAYFVASEALTNVAKYACATVAQVRLTREGARLVIEIADNGAGGADPRGGSGLRGLADRVDALDGRLAVVSPAGAGTSVRAELPCAS